MREAFEAQRFQFWEDNATHLEKYGWDADKARREYRHIDPPGRRGLPRFQGYFS